MLVCFVHIYHSTLPCKPKFGVSKLQKQKWPQSQPKTAPTEYSWWTPLGRVILWIRVARDVMRRIISKFPAFLTATDSIATGMVGLLIVACSACSRNETHAIIDPTVKSLKDDPTSRAPLVPKQKKAESGALLFWILPCRGDTYGSL